VVNDRKKITSIVEEGKEAVPVSDTELSNEKPWVPATSVTAIGMDITVLLRFAPGIRRSVSSIVTKNRCSNESKG
jgi:hypothetical protein